MMSFFFNKQQLGALLLVIGFFLTPVSNAVLPAALDDKPIPSLAPMLEKVTPAVVNIATEGKIAVRSNPLLEDPFFRRFFNVPNMPKERKTQSLGSGVIVDAKRGLVLTNNHVIANATEITVTLRDGRRLEAELVGTDPETDVAVIKVPAENLTALTIADSDAVLVGDFAVAIGNPFGLGQTVTSGIVSAVGRTGTGIESYENFIQTDASINPGNSGGALVNLRGELIGINTAIYSKSGGNIGIGFAIPTNMARKVMEQLVQYGEVNRGYLGVQTQDITSELAEAFDLEHNQGAVVVNIMSGSGGDKAGLKPGDVILEVNNKTIRTSVDIRNEVGLMRVGDKVAFKILRNGKRLKLSAIIESRETAKSAKTGFKNQRLAGSTFGDLGSAALRLGIKAGVVAVRVERGSRSWRSGLRSGDIITSVDRKPIHNLDDFLAAVNRNDKPLLLRVRRGNAAAFLILK